MKTAELVALMALLGAAPGCTLVALSSTVTTIATHNALSDSADRWNYTTPLIISGAIGLAVDIFLVIYMGTQWDAPLT